jgi:hypothetical protein
MSGAIGRFQVYATTRSELDPYLRSFARLISYDLSCHGTRDFKVGSSLQRFRITLIVPVDRNN